MRALDIAGEKFGRLTALEYAGAKKGKRHFICECECGYTVEKSVNALRRGSVRSCGCLYAESRQMTHFKHGETSGGQFTPEYRAWVKIRERCLNAEDRSYQWYGARGISISAEWRDSFEAFLLDMGRRPSPAHSVERVNNSGNYERGNCRWGTASEQARNTRRNRIVVLDGESMPLIVALEKAGHAGNARVYRSTLARLNRGLTFEQAMTEPSRYKHGRG